eukprot:CAMPEP_0177181902 /NCGR_PEP_ID=MMETSP0367-20130122/16178_1 /TAXON_ID=447022 ORGANISM="Scrippsiella hangoei-like, Strain SHHI-4" /NCGR_SAMPLE_ID=MMETSP0367 /ASSEMBLY_ACC=CAM_ASM_000362 /LENGTH=107 /DNA_ID=CAMNT_0018628795 /DNA_START=58 /DNA_END=381 /DNA_ORIENTATION=-
MARLLPTILLACAMVLGLRSLAFVTPPATSGLRGATAVDQEQTLAPSASASAALGGAVVGLVASAPAAHAAMLLDEIIPYAGATSFCIMWGIVLGFVLLRLQEAFPE